VLSLADVIEAMEQSILAQSVNRKGARLVAWAGNELCVEVDR
jgi:hypothetical protein